MTARIQTMGGGGLLARACSSGTSGLHHHLNSHSFLISKLSSGVRRGIGPSSPAAGRHLLAQSGVCFGASLLHFNPRVVQSVPFCCSNMDLPSPALQTRSAPKVAGPKISFCSACGAPVEERIPQGEEKPRYICTICGLVHYQNPKMVVGCLVADEDKVLLCKRSIEPSFGLWTLPAGYMELGESAAEGAVRETWEEANAEVTIVAPFAQMDIPQIGQSYIIYRAKLKTPHFSPGSESLECALFKIEDIPFNEIAFSSIRVALKLYVEDFNAGTFRVHHGVIEKRPGTSPSDPSGYTVRDHVYS